MCELDIIFNFEKAYFILDEFLLGGEVQETSKKNVLKAIEQADLLQEVSWEFSSHEHVLLWVGSVRHLLSSSHGSEITLKHAASACRLLIGMCQSCQLQYLWMDHLLGKRSVILMANSGPQKT